MPFKTLETNRPPISMEELGASIARRRAEGNIPHLPRNSGKNRTPSKIALLEAIAEIGGKW
jgi:hypothetical protein